MAPPGGDQDGLYPIRTVSGLTGVQAVTLRAWERRYNLIRPRRTPKGHRLYSRQDIERIQRVVELLGRGLAISQIAPLLEPAQSAPPTPGQEAREDAWARYRRRLLEAIETFDEPALEAAYNDVLSLYPADLVNTRLSKPLLVELGERWKQRPAGIAEEHFYSVYLRNKIGARIHHLNSRSQGPRLLLACLPGEYHEIGLLLFAMAAASHGYRVLILGANLPLEQIPSALATQPCAAVVLSSSTRLTRKGMYTEELPALLAKIGTPVLVGGSQSELSRREIEAAGAIVAGETHQQALQVLAATLADAR
jgi:DNA-binding transcriptional MerR regulator/methylmalonyl-CoA mutase cobalamin-binding subunit